MYRYVECTTIPPSCSTQSWPNGECVDIVMFRSRLGRDALVSELAFLFLGVTLAVEGSPFSWVGFWAALCFLFCLSMASWADSLRASSNSLASSASSCPGSWEWVREWLLVNSSSSSSRALKCFLMNSEVSEDSFSREDLEVVWVLLDAFWFWK